MAGAVEVGAATVTVVGVAEGTAVMAAEVMDATEPMLAPPAAHGEQLLNGALE